MTTSSARLLVRLRRLADPAPDAALLERFIRGHDEDAFAELVARHGPMVLRVCRRVLGDADAAEDAFQAAFLALARGAAAVRRPSALAAWLHGAAYRVALKARAARHRRLSAVRPGPLPDAPDPRPDPLAEVSVRELLVALDAEVQNLPEVYRLPVILCCLEGKTQGEAARQLGWTPGSLQGRLERGRKRLQDRLAKRGLALSAALAVVGVSRSAGLPAVLAATTVRAALTGAVNAAMPAKVPALLALLLVGAAVSAAGVFTQAPPAKEQTEGQEREKGPATRKTATDLFGDPLPPGAVGRLGTVRFRNQTWVQDAACSPDGKALATADEKVIRLWDTATGKEIREYRGHQSDVSCLAFSKNGSYLASGGKDRTVRLWDVATARELRRFEGHGSKKQQVSSSPVSQVFFTPDGKNLISTGEDETIRLWDTATGEELRRFEGHRDRVARIALAADGVTLAAYCKKPNFLRENKPGEVRVWDVATSKALRHWLLPDDLVFAAFSPDLKHLVTVPRTIGQNGAKLWDVMAGKLVRTLSSPSHRAAFSADGKTLYSVDGDFLRAWDVNTGAEVRRVEKPSRDPFAHLAVCPDGKTLMSWGSENAVHLTDLTTGKALGRFEGHTRAVTALAFSPDGKLVASGEGDEIRLWDSVTQKQIRRIMGQRISVIALTFTPDGKMLFSGSANGTTQLWEVASGREMEIHKASESFGAPTAFSPDRKRVATCFVGQGLLLRDVTTAKQFLQLAEAAEGERFQALAFSPDGKVLVAGGGRDRTVRRWDMDKGNELPPLGGHSRFVNGLVFSPDGRLLAAVSGSATVYIWDVSTLRERLVVDTGECVTSVAFSPDGRFLATADRGWYPRFTKDGKPTGNKHWDKVSLVDLATGKVVHRFGNHRGGVTCLAFSPDGKWLASGSDDTATLIWDMTRVPRPRPTPLRAEELNGRWTDLAGEDAAKAHRAVWALAAAPAQSVPFLKRRLRLVAEADPQRVARLLADSGSDRFADRQKATQQLERLGATAKPALRKALAGQPPLEARRRIELLLARPDGAWTVQAARAVEALEHAGTAEARQLLQGLADGVSDALLTQEARAALRRLKKRLPPA